MSCSFSLTFSYNFNNCLVMAALALIAVVVGKSEARPAAPRVCRLPVISATATTVWVYILLIGCLFCGAGATAPSPPPCNMVTGQCGSGKGPCELNVCCSQWGWCGTTVAYCNEFNQTAYSNGGSCAPQASPPPSAPPPWWEFCGDATCNSAVADTEAPSSQ